jgi:hypothetical protein
MVREMCLLTIIIAFASSLTTAQTTGRITGVVITGDGVVLDHVDVCTSVTSGNHITTNCRVPVDGDGHFQIENIKFGSYDIFAINEEEGYSIENNLPA